MRISGVEGLSVQRVDRTTADVQTAAAVPIYTIGTGRIWLFGIVGEVTTIIGAGTTPDAKFQSNPTTGTTTDLCATLNIASDDVGSIYTITGVITDAMLRTEHGGVRAPLIANPMIIPIGAIEFICDENVAGSIKFSAWWAPFDDGATLVAA